MASCKRYTECSSLPPHEKEGTNLGGKSPPTILQDTPITVHVLSMVLMQQRLRSPISVPHFWPAGHASFLASIHTFTWPALFFMLEQVVLPPRLHHSPITASPRYPSWALLE